MAQRPKQDPDAHIENLARLAKYGDADAGYMLHALLASHLSDAAISGVIPPSVAKRLCDMHAGIALGNSATDAMMMSAPSSRPIRGLERDRVFTFVADMVACFEHVEGCRDDLEAKGIQLPQRRPNMAEVYRVAAAAFSLSTSRVKAIYLEERRRLADMD